MNRLETHLARFHKSESGAVLLLSLAAVLIIMMMAWVIIDAGSGARDKVELQAQADTAAFSQASVRARAMNMIAYSNISKRSIVSITATYMGMWLGYTIWLGRLLAECCLFCNWSMCIRGIVDTIRTYLPEGLGDYRKISGFMFVPLPPPFLGNGGDVADYHGQDVQAIDNYQNYMMGVTPWWGYSEALVRGLRTGATTLASFPPPSGRIGGSVGGFLGSVTGALPGPLTGMFTRANRRDRLPWTRTWGGQGQGGSRDGWGNGFNLVFGDSRWTMIDEGMRDEPAWWAEHAANILLHRQRSGGEADTNEAIGLGVAAFPLGYNWVTKNLDGDARFLFDPDISPYLSPLIIERPVSAGDWQTTTSNLIFAYGNRPTRFSDERQKYTFMTKEYNMTLGGVQDFIYKNAGDWSLARAEISYQDGNDYNPFRPSWTARMRPVALPTEWQEAGYDLNQAYHDVLPFLGLTAVVSGANIGSAAADMANMELKTRAFGHSTIEGIAK